MFALNLRGKLIAGFAALIAIATASAGVSVWQAGIISSSIEQVATVRSPTALLGMRMADELSQTGIALRDQMISPDDIILSRWDYAWASLKESRDKMDELAASFPTDAQRDSWKAVRPLFGELEEAHKALLALVNTPAQYPALTTYEKMVTPQLQPLEAALTELVTREIQNPQANERLLAATVGLQSSILSAVRDLRGYVHRGQDEEKAQFEQAWNKVNERLKAITDMAGSMSPDQMRVLNRVRVGIISIRRGATLVINERSGPTWNAPMAHLTDRVAPISEKILSALQGPLTPGGERKGGLIDGQTTQLTADTTAAAEMARSQSTILMIAAGLSALAGLAIAFLLARMIATPIAGMTVAMRRLSEGALDTEIPGRTRRDEIGAMAGAMEVFRDTMAAAEEARAAQDAARAAEAERLARRNAVAEDFVARMSGLAETFTASSGRVEDAARNLAATAEETSRQAGEVAGAAETASMNVQTVAASTEELAASVREINVAGRPVLRECREGGGRCPPHRGPDPQSRRRRRPHRRRHQPHQGDRRPDQPAGPQRHHRGGARRRGRPRLRHRRLRGEEPRGADWPGHRGHRRQGRGDPGGDRQQRRSAPSPPPGGHQGDHLGGGQCRRGAGIGNRRDRRQLPAGGGRGDRRHRNHRHGGAGRRGDRTLGRRTHDALPTDLSGQCRHASGGGPVLRRGAEGGLIRPCRRRRNGRSGRTSRPPASPVKIPPRGRWRRDPAAPAHPRPPTRSRSCRRS